jgi:hypothetical protein
VPEDALGGPLAKGDLGHQFGTHPARGSGDERRRGRLKWALVVGQVAERLAEPGQIVDREPGAYLAGEAQLVVLVVAEQALIRAGTEGLPIEDL